MKAEDATAAAKMIASGHNNTIQRGMAGKGFLVFNRDGFGGAWHSSNARPDTKGKIVVKVGLTPMSLQRAQEIVNRAAMSD